MPDGDGLNAILDLVEEAAMACYSLARAGRGEVAAAAGLSADALVALLDRIVEADHGSQDA